MRLILGIIKGIPVFVGLLLFQQTFSQNKPNGDGVYEKVEVEASFPGGEEAWVRYVSDDMNNANFDKFKNSDQGTNKPYPAGLGSLRHWRLKHINGNI